MVMEDWTRISEEWLSREDATCRDDRIARLNWLGARMPPAEYLTFPGGLTAKYLFEEARYCFVYGQFLATIVLSLAFVERTLAALFYANGRDDLERANIRTLLREARNANWVTDEEFGALERARTLRNPVAHFRRPLHEGTIEYRAVQENEIPYAIIEQDARHAITVVMNLLAKNAV
ncbi:MAG: hypothetical protein ACE5JU_25050 [Candidatus Binatia bacterium]